MAPLKKLHLTAAALAAAFVIAPALFATAENTAPTDTELANATYQGIEAQPVRLENNLWQGEPVVPGGASRPQVGLVEDFKLSGDVNDDGIDEAVVVLWQSSGGSRTYFFLAVMGRAADGVVNIGSAPIGDRVQIRSGRIDNGEIKLDLVQQGPGDAGCCPSQLVERGWSVGPDGLIESPTLVTGKLSPATIGNRQWILSRFTRDEAAPARPQISLNYREGQFTGRSGCNKYFVPVHSGDSPGEIVVGPVGGTRMACAEEEMHFEHRYLAALGASIKFSYQGGKLALTWHKDNVYHTMLFIPGKPNGGPS